MSAVSVAAATPPLIGAARARKQATAVAAFGAVVPTVLAAQGMAALAVDVLGFHVLAAVALSGFLELALVSSALLARAAALAGRPGGADAVAVWVVSAMSGVLSGLHELIETTASGHSAWTADPDAVLAAGVRTVAPLVAAWLWERVLQAARAEQAERTLSEIRRDHRLLHVARAALTVRRLTQVADGRTRPATLRRALRRLDKAHLAALRTAPPASDLAGVLAAVGQVDHLPAQTLTATTPATRAADVAVRTPAGELDTDALGTDTLVVAGTVPDGGRPDIRVDRPQLAVRPVASSHARRSMVSAPVDGPDMVRPAGPPTRHPDVALSAAVELIRDDPHMTGAALAAALGRRNVHVSARTGQRLRARAHEALRGDTTTATH